MVALAKEQKQVQVVERHEKSNGYVYYEVRSSNGKDTYATTLRNGKATGCTCPSRLTCYHMTQLEIIEAIPAKPARTRKPRRSAANASLIAKLQLPDGVKIRKVRGGLVKAVVAPVPVVVEAPTTCPPVTFQVAGQSVTAPTAAEALLKALELISQNQKNAHRLPTKCPVAAHVEPKVSNIGADILARDLATRGSLHGNRGFSILRT